MQSFSSTGGRYTQINKHGYIFSPLKITHCLSYQLLTTYLCKQALPQNPQCRADPGARSRRRIYNSKLRISHYRDTPHYQCKIWKPKNIWLVRKVLQKVKTVVALPYFFFSLDDNLIASRRSDADVPAYRAVHGPFIAVALSWLTVILYRNPPYLVNK